MTETLIQGIIDALGGSVGKEVIVFIISMIPIEVSGSKFPVGSSHISIFGLFTIARAIDTRCCSPPDNWSG